MQLATVFLLFLPLAGALVLALAGRVLPRRLGETLACLTVAGSLGAALAAWRMLPDFADASATIHLFEWFSAGNFSASADLLLNPLSLLMAVMVCFVSLIIHLYSVFFMRNDTDWARYFCYLNLFVFSMLVIVLAGDLVFLFLGWEGVGFCSFALIGFWYQEPERVVAGKKAFIVTRIGDVAFIAAIVVLYNQIGSLGIGHILQAAPGLTASTVTLLGLLLLWAAMGKSAQLPLLVWLPDAMAGPTPVSALIHAATMVTAGVYLLMRLYPMIALSHTVMVAIAATGALTALFASFSALAQRDIKRVLAWSTISQVGYMFLGIGAGDPAGSFFHLLAHAFFKSLLFMAAGIVIQALGEEHDIFRMGRRTRKAAPGVVWIFLCGAVALAALPPFSGFFSKGRILLAAMARATDQPGLAWSVLWGMGALAALLTAIYTFRMFFLAFTGDNELEPRAKSEPVPGIMLHVLWPLALLALVAGALDLPGSIAAWTGLPGDWLDSVLRPVAGLVKAGAGATQSLELPVELIDAGLALSGLLVALILFGPQRSHRMPADTEKAGAASLLLAGFGLDRLYLDYLARPYRVMARVLWKGADDGGVDAAAMGAGRLAAYLGGLTGRWSVGRLTSYLGYLLIGLVIIVLMLAAIGARQGG